MSDINVLLYDVENDIHEALPWITPGAYGAAIFNEKITAICKLIQEERLINTANNLNRPFDRLEIHYDGEYPFHCFYSTTEMIAAVTEDIDYIRKKYQLFDLGIRVNLCKKGNVIKVQKESEIFSNAWDIVTGRSIYVGNSDIDKEFMEKYCNRFNIRLVTNL